MVWNGLNWVKFEFYFTIKLEIEPLLVKTNPGPKESCPWKIFSMPKTGCTIFKLHFVLFFLLLQILVLSANYNGIDYFPRIQKEDKTTLYDVIIKHIITLFNFSTRHLHFRFDDSHSTPLVLMCYKWCAKEPHFTWSTKDIKICHLHWTIKIFLKFKQRHNSTNLAFSFTKIQLE